MNRCRALSEVGRRQFLRGGTVAAAGAAFMVSSWMLGAGMKTPGAEARPGAVLNHCLFVGDSEAAV